MSVESQESEWSCVCVLGVSILSLSMIFSTGFCSCSKNMVFCFIYIFFATIIARLIRVYYSHSNITMTSCVFRNELEGEGLLCNTRLPVDDMMLFIVQY